MANPKTLKRREQRKRAKTHKLQNALNTLLSTEPKYNSNNNFYYGPIGSEGHRGPRPSYTGGPNAMVYPPRRGGAKRATRRNRRASRKGRKGTRRSRRN